MKKSILLFSLCGCLAACNSNSSTSENAGNSTAATSTNATEMSAATPSSDTDTSSTPAGTNQASGGASLADVEKGAKLISLSDCTTCHRVDQKLVGPAYEEVAQKYQATEKDTEYLAGKIIEGGKGVWGEIPMSPHPNISREDARLMALYVLSLKK